MSKNDYSFNQPGGLMPLIQALIRPPDSRESSRQANKKPQHPYYKRPGRGHNRNVCDCCSEGGDLICCDRCPASFHLGCHDPPLSEEDIPIGIWLCHMCQMLQNQRKTNATKLNVILDENATHNETQNYSDSRSSTPNIADGQINAAKIRLGQKRNSSRVSSCSENSTCIDKELRIKIQRIDATDAVNGNDMKLSNTVIESYSLQQQQLNTPNQDSVENEKENNIDSEPSEEPSINVDKTPATTTTTIATTFTDSDEVNEKEEENESERREEPRVSIEDNSNLEINYEVQIEIEGDSTENTPNADITREPMDKVEGVQNGEMLPEIENNDDEEVNVKTPLDELIRAASILNPRQFKLPRELNIFPQFPGDDKVSNEGIKTASKKNNRNGSNGNNNKPRHELDSQGLVPLPAATCFYCRKSCKKAPLLSCDYCPLFFHQDCLDPPLTALPTTLWMCPNHAQQFVDWKLVTSISATERVKLWNHFSGPMDYETIKADFFRKVHCKNPPFRYKLKPKSRHCAEIPPMVDFHYKNPIPLLPSLRDVLRCERVYRERGFQSIDLKSFDDDLDKDLHELRKAKEKIKNHELNELKTEKEGTIKKDQLNAEDAANDSKSLAMTFGIGSVVKNAATIGNDEKIIEKLENNTHLIEQPDIADTNAAQNLDQNPEHVLLINENENDRTKSSRRRKRNPSTKSFGVCDDIIELSEEVFNAKSQSETTNHIYSSKAIDEQLDGLDIDVIKKLAFIQLQKILNESPDIVIKYQNESANKAIKVALSKEPVNILLPSQLLSKEDITRISQQFDDSCLTAESDENNDPAYAGVSQPIPPSPHLMPECCVYSNGLENIQDDNERALAIARRLKKPLRESKIRARAVLTPVGDILAGKKWYTNSYTDDSIFMRYRSLVIGIGPNCDVQIRSLRKCARLSAHHATIFYDEFTKLYELLNYSEHGTEVNGQFYSLDFTEYPQHNANRARDLNGFYKNVREIIDKKRGVKRIQYGLDENTKMSAPELPKCKCHGNPQLMKGWEGSAILSHGSLVRFGCLAFVFSIIDEINDD